MLATWSIRVYFFLTHNKLEVETPEQALEVAELVLTHKMKNGGIKCAVEMYRAAGRGVYEITRRLEGRWTEDQVRNWCNHLDLEVFHWDLNR